MSNPYSKENLEVAGRAWALDTFWNAQSKNSLQTWPSTDSRVLHLSTNKRSGEDTWFSQLLDACRVGNMDHMDYCFIHGFPTEKCGSWMVQTQTAACGHEQCLEFGKHMQHVFADQATPWQERWRLLQEAECDVCKSERTRRKRVLQCHAFGGLSEHDAVGILRSKRFQESVFITEFNQPVCLYSLLRSQMFAQSRQQQLFWIQAEDFPPRAFFGDKSESELKELKAKWLRPSFHARKTDGILSLLPCTYDIPLRVTNVGRNSTCKKHGVHNGSLCRLRQWALHEVDEARVRENTDTEIVLQYLPKVLYVEMVNGLKVQVEGLPKNWFPLKPESSKLIVKMGVLLVSIILDLL